MNYCSPGTPVLCDEYFYTPSLTAQRLYFYPKVCGCCVYDHTYKLFRSSFDSFLIMYITKGNCIVTANDQSRQAAAGQVVFIDCYKPHGYYTDTSCEALWLHFDGPMASGYAQQILTTHGTVITLQDSYQFQHHFNRIYSVFHTNQPVREPLLSQYITVLLTDLLLSQETAGCGCKKHNLDEVISYINEHLSEDLSLDKLAEKAALSPYYFIRVFKQETGLTPHQYVIRSRVDSAKYLLRSTSLSIKEIAFRLGFSCEAAFCAAFKKDEQQTPGQYRSACGQ